MRRTPEETALFAKLLFKKSGQKRARVSTETIRRLSGRATLRASFLNRLQGELDDLGLIMIELERGGYGLILSSALEGAPPITKKRYFNNGELAMELGEVRAELE